MSTAEQIAKETLERVTRLESRIVQLGDHVGANLRSKQKIDIYRSALDEPIVRIDSLDVSVSRILTELRQAGAHAHQVHVYHGDRLVFTLYPNH